MPLLRGTDATISPQRVQRICSWQLVYKNTFFDYTGCSTMAVKKSINNKYLFRIILCNAIIIIINDDDDMIYYYYYYSSWFFLFASALRQRQTKRRGRTRPVANPHRKEKVSLKQNLAKHV